MPPLRERRADIAALASRILEALARKLRLRRLPELAPDALEALENYTFPGNIRELENILERAVTLSEETVIQRQYLRLSSPLLDVPRPATDVRESASVGGATMAPARPAPDTSADLESQLEALERERIQAALEACHYNKTKAARHLGITFRALRYRLAKLGMN